MWSNQTGVLGLGHSVCFGRYASGARLATVWSTWKGMLVLRQCGHAQNAMVSLRVNPGKQKLLVKWWTLAACPWRPRSPAGKWPKHAPALHPFALVSIRRNTRSGKMETTGPWPRPYSDGQGQETRDSLVELSWSTASTYPLLCTERPVLPFFKAQHRTSKRWFRPCFKTLIYFTGSNLHCEVKCD